MIIDLTRLKSNIISSIDIDEEVKVDNELLKNTDILELKDTYINGKIIKSGEEYIIDASIKGIMVLPDTLTLDPIEYEFDTKIEGNIIELLEEINLNSKKIDFTIDIFPIIWENILMEVPIRITNNDDVKMEGEGWKLVTEKEDKTNPAFLKLKELLDEK